jgi:2'-5' RNA ligase
LSESRNAQGVDTSELRLFLAVWPPHPVRAALVSVAEHCAWPPQSRRTPAERLHLTLHFIGAVPAARVAALADGLAVPFRPFELTFTTAASWGGIAVLTAGEVPSALADLHGRLADALRGEALPLDTRPFRPHVTLARQASGVVWPKEIPRVQWQARDGYALVRSLPGGAGYETLRRYG